GSCDCVRGTDCDHWPAKGHGRRRPGRERARCSPPVELTSARHGLDRSSHAGTGRSRCDRRDTPPGLLARVIVRRLLTRTSPVPYRCEAYLLKDAPGEELLASIRKVHAGETFIPPRSSPS